MEVHFLCLLELIIETCLLDWLLLGRHRVVLDPQHSLFHHHDEFQGMPSSLFSLSLSLLSPSPFSLATM